MPVRVRRAARTESNLERFTATQMNYQGEPHSMVETDGSLPVIDELCDVLEMVAPSSTWWTWSNRPVPCGQAHTRIFGRSFPDFQTAHGIGPCRSHSEIN